MTHLRLAVWPAICGALALIPSCSLPPSHSAGSPAPAPSAAHPPAPVARPAKAASPPPNTRISSRGAPPTVSVPMAGAPTPRELQDARLVKLACEDDRASIAARIAKMRAEVDEEFKRWHDAQPGCWQSFRQQWEWDRLNATGGLGLRGYGVGGGGYGEGIGLGSIGTIGHGAGVGRVQAFGSGHGRLGVARAKLTSQTNNQVAGVDEADIVKTDGRYVYFAANGALRIVEALHPKLVSVTRLEGSVRDMFVDGDRAVVFASSAKPHNPCTYGYDCQFTGDGTSTHVAVIDIGDRAHPKVVRRLAMSGSLMTSRRVGSAVHTVVADGDSETPEYSVWPADLQECGTEEKIVKAKFSELKFQNERAIKHSVGTLPTLRENGKARSLCGSEVLKTAKGSGRAFTTLVSFDLLDDERRATTTMIQSRPGAVFASGEALYLSVVERSNSADGSSFYGGGEVSEIHKFRISADSRKTRYVGSGAVPGHVLNQFAMDEWFGYLRIATTRGRVPNPHVTSELSVLAESAEGNLVRVGAVDKIAPGEDIRAVRFDGDRGYIVTFKKTDPLFVVDLFDPAKPTILGELKIPGFSTYMQRLDDDHLLSIGFDADDKGDFAFFDGLILQLFDVHDPTRPKLLHKEKIGTRGSSSEAATNHLAFTYFAEKGLLAIPMTVCEGGGNGSNGNDLVFSGLYVYDVSVEKGFARLGGIDHKKTGVNCGTWWSNANSAVKRSVFLDDLVYSVAADRVKVQRLGHLGEDVADISLMP